MLLFLISLLFRATSLQPAGAQVSDYGAPSSVCACDRTFGPHKEKEKVSGELGVIPSAVSCSGQEALWLYRLPHIWLRTSCSLLQLRSPRPLLQPPLHLQEDLQHQGEGERQEALLLLLLQALKPLHQSYCHDMASINMSSTQMSWGSNQSQVGFFWHFFLGFSM